MPKLPDAHRILVVDDNVAIHGDFRKVLGTDAEDAAQAALAVLEADLFGETRAGASRPKFEIDLRLPGTGRRWRWRAMPLAEGRPFAMAFVDMRMPPGWDGLQTIEHLWAADPDVQVVICSAHTDYDWSEVVDRLQHSDKLLVLRKPAEPIEVLQCATALTRKWQNERLVRDQMERLEQVITLRTRGLEAANRQLRHLATHDALTGLPNRVLLDDRLTQAVAHADRDGRSFALLVCDLDRFKLVNDSLGHHAGDELLQEVARRLTGLVRTVDTVARFGGDEFVLLITSIHDPEDAQTPGGAGDRSPASARANRRHRRAYLAEHRHRVLSRRRNLDRGADRACGCRDVLRQTARPRQRAMLRRRNERRLGGAGAARKRPAQRHRSQSIRALLPAQGEHEYRRACAAPKR